jgi:hypothetical protein
LAVSLPRVNSEFKPGEALSRFLKKEEYNARKGIVNPKPLLPSRDGKTSVFRIVYLTDAQIWKIADLFVYRGTGSKHSARAELNVSFLLKSGLILEPDFWPPRHVNITGWPLAKDERMSIARDLAAEAILSLRHD